jgi:chemotaxis protein methyltransferase CheR
MTLHTQDADHDRLYTLIQSRTGLILNEHQRTDVSILFNDLIDSQEISSIQDLFLLLFDLPSTDPLWQRIVHVITVGETYFFRNMAQFNALRSHILFPIIEEKRKTGRKYLRLWSAGSSTGEEAYTLAILLRQMLPDIDSWSIRLLATDINETYLQQAQEGLYRARSFRSETPDEMREIWFTRERDGYRLSPVIRKMVTFSLLNLVSDEYPTVENDTVHMDVIFCRNVTIYFDRPTTRQIAQRFHAALATNGWLVVGHSEPQSDVYRGFVPRNFKDTVIYQKAGSEATAAQMSPAQTPTSTPPTLPTRPTPDKKSTQQTPTSTPPTLATRPTPDKKSTQQAKAPTSKAPVVKPLEIKMPTLKGSASPPSPDEDLWSRAKQAADLRNWGEARKWLDRAEEKDKFRPEVHYLRGLIELEAGNINDAVRLLRRSVYCDVNFSLAHYTLGDVYAQQGAQKEAARHWKLALTAVEAMNPKETLPYSDALTVELFVTLLVDRLTGL